MTAFIVIFKPAHYAMTDSLTLLTTWMRLHVNTIPPYQHCLINTHHLKHAEELLDLLYLGTMKLWTMLSDSGRRPNANGERQRLLMISLISSQRETMWPFWWMKLGGTSTLSLWQKTVLKLFNPFPSNHADVSGKLPPVFLWSFVGSKKEPRLLSVLEYLGDSDTMFWDDFDRILWKTTGGKSIFLAKNFSWKLFNQLFIE